VGIPTPPRVPRVRRAESRDCGGQNCVYNIVVIGRARVLVNIFFFFLHIRRGVINHYDSRVKLLFVEASTLCIL
jgi:hypothetical protein